MASKYIQKYPVPNDFEIILNDFAKEVLRAQPDDIIQFAVEYFEFKEKNPNSNFPHSSENLKYNIARKDQPKEYQATPYDQLEGNIQQRSQQSEQQGRNEEQDDEEEEENQYQNQNQHQQKYGDEQESLQQQQQQYQEQGQHSFQQEREVSSKQSQRSNKTQTTHPEEKQVTKDFMGNLYDSAVQQTVQQSQQANNTENQNQEQEQEGFQYEGPVEEYEQAARKIQANFRNKKANQ